MTRTLGITLISFYLAAFALRPLAHVERWPSVSSLADGAMLLLALATLAGAAYASRQVWLGSIRATRATTVWAILAFSHLLLREVRAGLHLEWYWYATGSWTVAGLLVGIIFYVRSLTAIRPVLPRA